MEKMKQSYQRSYHAAGTGNANSELLRQNSVFHTAGSDSGDCTY